MLMEKLTNTSINQEIRALKNREVILDKKGRPMTEEQIEKERCRLIGNFRLDFLCYHADDSLMADYEEDFRRLGIYDKFVMLKDECYKEWHKSSKKHLKEYTKEHVLSDEDKKHMPEKSVKRNEKMIVEHLVLNRQLQREIKQKSSTVKQQAEELGIVLKRKTKCDSIDKILDSCIVEPENTK